MVFGLQGLFTPGYWIGHMDHTGCHQSVFLTTRQLRVVTPGECQIGYMDHPGCHQLAFCLQNKAVKSANPGCQIGYMDHTGCRQLVRSAKPYQDRGVDAALAVALQVAFERQTLKPIFHLIGYRFWV
jgi:hypothetical protein